MQVVFFLALLAVHVFGHRPGQSFGHAAAHRLVRKEVSLQAKNTRVVGNVTDPTLSRDSCGSVKMGLRTFWTCRDTSIRLPDSEEYGYLFVNTVGWTDNNWDGSPAIQAGGPKGAGSDGTNNILLMKGPRPALPAFFPLSSDMCSNSGACPDGKTRWTGWPDSPPMIASTALDGTITAYTWVVKQHIVSLSLEVLNSPPPATLYKMTYKLDLDPNVVPTVTTVNSEFWGPQEISYGAYGNVVKDGWAYLYGLAKDGVALARVLVGSIEDRNSYQYYVNGVWTSTKPDINDMKAVVPNAGTRGQGTFYYSERHQSYIWIGQNYPDIHADFYMTTAPTPEGPWTKPYFLYQGRNGDGYLPAYSLQAHPDMLRWSDDGIYLSWTQFFKSTTYAAYVTPLVYISFV